MGHEQTCLPFESSNTLHKNKKKDSSWSTHDEMQRQTEGTEECALLGESELGMTEERKSIATLFFVSGGVGFWGWI